MANGIAVLVDGSQDDDLTNNAQIEVEERMGEPTLFRLRVDISILDKDIPLLKDGRFEPGSLITIVASKEETKQCLVHGPVRGQKIHLVHGGAESYLEVEGADTSIAMDRENKAAIWPDQTDSDAVTGILSQYGYTPDVETTSASHMETKHILVQRETDFHFVQRMAKRNGFLFWISADENGVETAHFKKPPVDGEAASSIAINLDLPAFQTLDLHWDVECPTSTDITQQDLNTHQLIDGSVTESALANLGDKSLSEIASETRLMHLPLPADDAGELSSRSQGLLTEAGWFIRATGETSVHEANCILRAHTVVDLQGLGTRHSGKYFVSAIKHKIDSTSHCMTVELVRNGWGAA